MKIGEGILLKLKVGIPSPKLRHGDSISVFICNLPRPLQPELKPARLLVFFDEFFVLFRGRSGLLRESLLSLLRRRLSRLYVPRQVQQFIFHRANLPAGLLQLSRRPACCCSAFSSPNFSRATSPSKSTTHYSVAAMASGPAFSSSIWPRSSVILSPKPLIIRPLSCTRSMSVIW